MFDADFPEGIAQDIPKKWIPQLTLLSAKNIFPTLHGVADHDVIRAVWQAGHHGLITCNHGMLDVPETLAMIGQTRMTVVACHGKTNKVQAATGLLLLNLGNIADNYRADQPQIWELKQNLASPKGWGNHVSQVERNCRCTIKDYELPRDELKARVVFPKQSTR